MRHDFYLHHYQRGMSASGILFLLVVIGFIATAGTKLGPSYIDNQKASSALQSLKEEYHSKDVAEISDKMIIGSLRKILSVNLVNPIIPKSIEIRRARGDIIVSINYEVREHFMSNVDVVAVFENEVNLAD